MSRIQNMRIALLGGRGYIGTQLKKRLLELGRPGFDIVVGSRNTAGRSVDITDPDQVKHFVSDADIVVNLVGIMEPNPPRYTFENVHHMGPKNIAEALVAAGRNDPSRKRLLIHLSALGADISSKIPYPRSKAQGELAIKEQMQANCKNVKAVIIRPGLVIGPEDNFLNRFSMLLRYLPVFPVFGGGQSLYQPISAGDLCEIISNLCVNMDQLDSDASQSSENCAIIEVGGRQTLPFKSILQATAPLRPLWLPPYLIPVPAAVGLMQAAVMERLFPANSALRITQDQVRLLQLNNCVHGSTAGYSKRSFIVSTNSATEEFGRKAEELMFSSFDKRNEQLRGLDDLFANGRWK